MPATTRDLVHGGTKVLQWEQFKDSYGDGEFKTRRATCRYCFQSVSTTSNSSNTYNNNYNAVPGTADRLRRAASSSSTDNVISKPSWNNLKHLVTYRLSSQKKQEVDLAFPHSMNMKALPFQALDTPEFEGSFKLMSSSWKPLGPKSALGPSSPQVL